MMRFNPPKKERGAALLTVLLLVAVMAVIAATALDRLNLATKLAGNGSAMAQARAYSYAAEEIAAKRIEDLLARNASQLTLRGDWHDTDIPVPLDNGIGTIRLTDANNCFNLNSLVTEGDNGFAIRPSGLIQFRNLMLLLDITENEAFVISESTADWIDSDGSEQPSGAEDSYYRSLDTPYMPPNRLIADKSELLSIRGVTPDIYSRLSAYVCALPSDATVINVNTLGEERAELLSMLFGQEQLPLASAKAILANRPQEGYGSLVRFYERPAIAELQISARVRSQIALASNWFMLQSRIGVGEIELQARTLISAQNGATFIERRSWGGAG